MNQDDYLLTITVPTILEEAMVDCLLAFQNAQGFASFTVSAHGRHVDTLSLAEQVFGRKKKINFQIYVEGKTLTALLTHLKTDFSGSGMQYWVAPVVEHGEI